MCRPLPAQLHHTHIVQSFNYVIILTSHLLGTTFSQKPPTCPPNFNVGRHTVFFCWLFPGPADPTINIEIGGCGGHECPRSV